VDVFRVMGPAHCTTGITELSAESQDPCSLYGGCRLLTCYEWENIDEIGNEVIDEELPITRNYGAVDWYRESCDFCHRRIRAKHHAVRMPLDGGGWQGCYCSWEHVRLDVPRPNQLRLEMIAAFEREYLEVGLYDRIWEDEELLPPLEMAVTPEALWDMMGADFSLVTKRESGSRLQLPPMVPPSPIESPYTSPAPSPRVGSAATRPTVEVPVGLPVVSLTSRPRPLEVPRAGPLVPPPLVAGGPPPWMAGPSQVPRGTGPSRVLPSLPGLPGLPPRP
jgi:hypothetical protein